MKKNIVIFMSLLMVTPTLVQCSGLELGKKLSGVVQHCGLHRRDVLAHDGNHRQAPNVIEQSETEEQRLKRIGRQIEIEHAYRDGVIVAALVVAFGIDCWNRLSNLSKI